MTLAANFLLAVVTGADAEREAREARGDTDHLAASFSARRPRALSSRLDKCLQRFTPLVSHHSKTSCLNRRGVLFWQFRQFVGIELLMMHGERWICRLFRKHFERKERARAHRASEQPSSPPPAPLESHGINSQSVLSLPRCFTMPLMSVSFYSTYCISMKL